MLGMINSSLDLFKMEQGLYRLHPEQVDVLPLLNGVTHELRDAIKRKQLSVTVSVDKKPEPFSPRCTLKGEQLLCYSMLANLILNAIEASPPEKSVQITVFQSEDQVTIKIENNGTVPEAVRPVFFNKFVTDGKRRGTGLGTYSAKLMAETMGGTITMTSGPEETTSVTVTLPKYK
jgi:signal transduction histidine kinase